MVVAVVVALVLATLAGGRIENLARIRLRFGALLFCAVVLRYGTEAAIRYGFVPAEDLRLPLYLLAFFGVAAILYANREQPGLIVAAVGVTANGLAILLNGGWMPVWPPALQLVGMSQSDLVVSFHRLLPLELGREFLLRGGPFGDLIPVPIPVLTNVMSIGDVFIAAGLAWYVFATLVAPEQEAFGEPADLLEFEPVEELGVPADLAGTLPGFGSAPGTAPGMGVGPAAGAAQGTSPGMGGGTAPGSGVAAGPDVGAGPVVAAGSGFAVTSTIARPGYGRAGEPGDLPGGDAIPGRLVRHRAPGLAPRSEAAAAAVLSRPLLLGGASGGVNLQPDVSDTLFGPPAAPSATGAATMAAGPAGGSAAAALPAGGSLAAAIPAGGAVAAPPLALPRPRRARLAGHPYVRLALDARFSALWVGQTISLLGDRLNQIALGVLVLSITGSALDVGLTFLAATLPNLLFGPFAGAFVDRWDQRRVMVLSDLIRAGLVLLVPLAAQHGVLLVYPVVFGVTTVSIFFRPARSAVIPRIVAADDLTPANAAMYTAETIADLAGYPIAGLFVAFLGSALTLAFWCDAVSYLVSAALLLSITIPPVARSVGPAVSGSLERYLGEIREAWRFLRADAPLLQNTLISGVAQLAPAATVALTVVYARDVLRGSIIPYPQSYAAIDLLIGLGSLAGGVAIGAVGSRWRKGHLVVAGYFALGIATILLGLTNNEVVALACAAAAGVANMVFIIPTQTLFAERTPQDLMGRVVGIRFSMVLGPLTLAMAVSGLLGQAVGVPLVFVSFGIVTALAGVVGLLLPAVRNA